MKINTIFIDLDGVLRHWSDTRITAAEEACNIDRGSLLSVAFSDNYLLPAITGEITHEGWCRLVKDRLEELYDVQVAKCLVESWNLEGFEIDHQFISKIQFLASKCDLVLVTNATTRLKADLDTTGVLSAFSVVVNSSDIKVAKPCFEFFEIALKISGSVKEQTIYIDDDIANVNAAESCGIDSIQHKSVAETLKYIERKCT